MRLIFQGSCPKDPLGSDINEDRWAFDEVHGRLALCDGASESFNSSIWAQILADKYILDPVVTPDWIANAIADYAAHHDYAAMSWSRQASYERGSFSTLLGIEYIRHSKTVDVLAVGDSLAVLIDAGKVMHSWPYSDPERFKDRPTLLATLHEHNAFVSKSPFWTANGTHFYLGELQSPRLICVTDALGEWVLRHAQTDVDAVGRLLEITTQEELVTLVVGERNAGRMRVDDSTVLVAAFDMDEEPDGLPQL